MPGASIVRNWLDWAGRIGADPGDTPDAALRKRLVVLLFVGTLPATALWSAIYFVAVKDGFECQASGAIEVKGAGRMEIWHVVGRRAG